MKENLLRGLDAFYLLCIWISGLAIAAMSLVIPWGVYARYVLGTGSSWPEPVAVLLMVTFTFFGAAAGYRAGAHIAVGMLVDRLPAALQGLLARLVDLLMLGVCLFVIVWGFKLCMETMGQSLADLPWMPVGITYLPLPLGSVATLVFVLEKALLGSQAHRAVVRFDHEEQAAGAAEAA
ncbi:C4-dicarboxylate ABC transporter [Pseudorhodoferax aquiterrae]|uniref:TRAP transporter small permease protein n=1 Tax=Pseudorhodoferax aquiterrae TaxID=747304 RepID=A0ABQ3GEG7_9BURK|nr:TRAP transporter small permease [Pseudorhodoferax aquiterrae]GHD03584.1 C4-dicarboxylate ABC transporter [Pseudorhodoferax aquiterrae]